MNKKAIIIVVFVLLLGVGGVFLLLEREDNILIEEIKFEPAKNYVIKDTPEGKIVENKNVGLSFKVPEGWRVEVREYDDEGGVELFTQDTEIDPNTNFPKSGCGIGVSIQYGEQKYQNIKKLIEEKEETIIVFNNHQGIMKIIFDNEKLGHGVSLEILGEKEIYVFNTIFAFEKKEICSQEFDRFLETVSIK